MDTSSRATTSVHHADGGRSLKPGSAQPALYGMRRSCEPCRRRKKKCDGGQPCRRCFRTRDECTYSMRVWHQPHPQQQQSRGLQPHSRLVQPTQALPHSTSGAALRHSGMLPFKRCRLSASPATGLVGMQENAFLSDFFGCIGFLPLTTQSHIRETMVKIMLSPAARQPPMTEDGCGEAGQVDSVAMNGEFGNACGGEELPMGPSTCIFWCAVALGALVKGSPIESVASYTQLAKEALAKSHSGPANAEVAKAWAILGYVYGFMGDLAKFQKYLALSDTFVTASMEQGSTDSLPLGFAEILQHREIGDPSLHTVKAVFSRKQVLPQLSGGATEYELYRYVMRSFHVFEQAVYARMLGHNNITSAGAEIEPPQGGAELGGGKGDGKKRHPSGVPESLEIGEAMASVWGQGDIMHFAPLKDAADRPSIRAGMGGMLINGTLLFDSASKGDVCGTLKRIGRCAEVFARYPGLSRSVMGTHWVHIASAALAALDASGARELYDTLRAAYNPFRPPGSPPVPPLEEWQGVSAICEDTYCRAVEGVIASETMKAFSVPATRRVPRGETAGGKGEESFNLVARKQSRVLAASVPPDEDPLIHGSTAPLTHGAPGSGGSGEWLEAVSAAKSLDASSTSRFFVPSRGTQGAVLDEEHGASSETDVTSGSDSLVGGLAAGPRDEVLLVVSASLSGEVVEDVEEDDVAAEDWLEVTTALLESGKGPAGEACGV